MPRPDRQARDRGSRVPALHLAHAGEGYQHRHASCALTKRSDCNYSFCSGQSTVCISLYMAWQNKHSCTFSPASLKYVYQLDATANLTPAKQLFLFCPICSCHILTTATAYGTASVQLWHARVALVFCAGRVSVKGATLAFLCHLLVLLEWAQGSWLAQSAVTGGCLQDPAGAMHIRRQQEKGTGTWTG